MQDGSWPAVPNVNVNGVPVPGYLVADGIYPAEPFIVKPHRGAAFHLSESQRRFNFAQLGSQ